MKRFSFRLDPVLEARKRMEDVIKRELGKKQSELRNAEVEKRLMQEDFLSLQGFDRQRRTQNLDIVSLRASVVYRHKLKKDIIDKSYQIESMQLEATGIRQRLTEATRSKRALELLREHRFSSWRAETMRVEQMVTDDVAQQTFVRQRSFQHQV